MTKKNQEEHIQSSPAHWRLGTNYIR